MSKAKKELKRKMTVYNRSIAEMNDIKSRLQCAYSAFNNTSDDSMLDACIFEISALNARYNYAVKQIKQLE